MSFGVVAGIAGALVGVTGGVIGTMASVRQAKGPRERRFTIRFSFAMWAGVVLLMTLLFLLPSPNRWFVWVPYLFILPLAIMYWNRRQQELRESDDADQDSSSG